MKQTKESLRGIRHRNDLKLKIRTIKTCKRSFERNMPPKLYRKYSSTRITKTVSSPVTGDGG